jgi:hypothetical protein
MLPMLTAEQKAKFDVWYAAYPLKQAKLDAMRAWVKTEPLHPSLEEMLAVLEQHKRSEKWHEGFIPMPSTYLNRGSFLDELKVSLPSQQSKLPEFKPQQEVKAPTPEAIEASRRALALVRGAA